LQLQILHHYVRFGILQAGVTALKKIEILLAVGARIPRWLRMQDAHVAVKPVALNGFRRRKVTITGGEATFVPGGAVVVRTPSTREFSVAFGERRVLSIFNCDTRTANENYFFCIKCKANTGEILSAKPASAAGQQNAEIKCVQCGLEWCRNV